MAYSDPAAASDQLRSLPDSSEVQLPTAGAIYGESVKLKETEDSGLDVDLSGDVKEDLCNYLDEIDAPGTFAVIKRLERVVDPGIKLLGNHDEEHIKVPLSTQDARKIIQAAHQAPFGKGTETIVDTDVRNTWELSSNQFVLSEQWQEYMDGVMKLACNDLGVRATEVKAELYKMLLYESGAMFKPHADSEKAPGMFGTLVISLPSAHFGGTVVASRGTERVSLQTHYHEYLAWYSDVTHEVLPVTSGYRWVLTYNLIQHQNKVFSAAEQAAVIDRTLHSIFTAWRSESPSTMVYLLEHQYTDASLSFSSLKHSDYLRAKQLLACQHKYGYTVYLASVEREVIDDGVGYDDEHEEKIELKRIIDVEGNEIAHDIPIDEDDILQAEPFDGRDPDEETYEGYTGNEGANSTQWYRDTAIVMLPNEKIADMFLAPLKRSQGVYSYTGLQDTKVLTLLKHFVTLAKRFPGSKGEQLRRGVATICRFIADGNAPSSNEPSYARFMKIRTYSDDTVSTAIMECAKLEQIEPLSSLASAFEKELSEPALQTLKESVLRFGLETLKPIFDKIVLNHKSISSRYKALSTLTGNEVAKLPTRADELSEMESWALQCLRNVFATFNLASKEDYKAAAQLAAADSSKANGHASVIPMIQNNGDPAEKTTFGINFLSWFYTHAELNKIPGPALKAQYKATMDLVLQYFAFRKAATPNLSPFGITMAAVVHHCSELELHEYSRFFLARITSEVEQMYPEDFQITIIEFLKESIRRLRQHTTDFDLDAYKKLFQTSLHSYIVRYVGKKPIKVDWALDPVECSCRDCASLNIFLRSPTDRVGRFPMGKPRRQHLHIQLDRYIDCTHETERRGSPQTLIVTKTGKGFEQRLSSWQQRYSSASEQLRELNTYPQFKDLLGDKYNDIMTLSAIRITTATSRMGSSRISDVLHADNQGLEQRQQAGSHNPPQIAGQKRRVSVVDLT